MSINTWLYAFIDKKSGVLSNYFVSSDPFEKVKRDVSISLLGISHRDPNSPFVLFGDDYDLVRVSVVLDELSDDFLKEVEHISCSELLVASRKAFEKSQDQTSPDSDEL